MVIKAVVSDGWNSGKSGSFWWLEYLLKWYSVVVGMVVELDEVFIGSGRSCNQTLLKW
jgi:hypothetical protein